MKYQLNLNNLDRKRLHHYMRRNTGTIEAEKKLPEWPCNLIK